MGKTDTNSEINNTHFTKVIMRSQVFKKYLKNCSVRDIIKVSDSVSGSLNFMSKYSLGSKPYSSALWVCDLCETTRNLRPLILGL